MNPKDWSLVKQLFQQAVTLSKDERDEFLHAHTKGKPEIYKHLKDMLLRDEQSDSSITNILSSNLEQIFEENNPLFPGDKIDNYEIVRLIGQGGMGAIFEGLYQTSNFHLRVAIKTMSTTRFTQESIKLFQTEQQILENLNHPHITRFIDSGTSYDGLPYLIMEYIDGEPIIDYCINHKLGIGQRIELFLQVCDAVSYAHQNLVVHRDIKPDNILVNSQGQAKLLDFGIAKLLNSNVYEGELMETQIGLQVLSPENAAPEQILNKMVTTRTDIYALGCLLYELFTEDIIVFNIDKNNKPSLEKAICEIPPVKPSNVLNKNNSMLESINYRKVSTLKSTLKGDLDFITLKALKKNPDDRYQNVEQFSGDLYRYLNNYPMTARSKSYLYLITHFIKRQLFSFTKKKRKW